MRWPAAVLAAALLAACARHVAPPAPAQAAPMCRLGPDGGIPVSDRGIGGTGAVADRGIGGTGAVADRGIGGTGIIGVITGFASVCIGGQEVGYDPAVLVLVDGRAATIEALRAGQVATIEAAGARLRAQNVLVRHEVSGPVDPAQPDGVLRVAGQRVVPAEGALGVAGQPGQWLEISGFRQPDSTILATRLDPRGPGETMVRGILQRDGGHWRLGTLEIRPASDQFAAPGAYVVAVGRVQGGVLFADTVEPDPVALDPAGYFGGRVGTLIIEGYAVGGRLRLGRGLDFAAPFAQGRAIARLERQADGGFRPAFIRPWTAGPAGLGGSPFGPRRFEAAPIPNRAMSPPGARAGAGEDAPRRGRAGRAQDGESSREGGLREGRGRSR